MRLKKVFLVAGNSGATEIVLCCTEITTRAPLTGYDYTGSYHVALELPCVNSTSNSVNIINNVDTDVDISVKVVVNV